MIRQAEASLRDGGRGQSEWALVGQQPRDLGRRPAVRPAGVRRVLLHQRGPSGAEFGDDATVGTGPIAWD